MNRGGAAATTWTVRGDGDGRRYRVGFPRSRFESWTFYTGSSLGHSYPPGRERGSLHRDSPVIDCLCLQKCWTHGRGAPSQSRRFCDNKEVLRVVTRLYDRRCRIFNWDAHGYAPLCGIEAACTALAPCCSTRARTAGGAYARNDDHIRDNFLQRPSVLACRPSRSRIDAPRLASDGAADIWSRTSFCSHHHSTFGGFAPKNK